MANIPEMGRGRLERRLDWAAGGVALPSRRNRRLMSPVPPTDLGVFAFQA